MKRICSHIISAWLLLPPAATSADYPRFLDSQLSGDMTRIYFSAQDPSTHEIHLFRMSIDGSDQTRLLELEHPQFTILADERRVLTQGGQHQLQLRDLAGSEILWEVEGAWNASVTTDGAKLVYVRATETRTLEGGIVLYDKQDYFSYDVATDKEKRLTSDGELKRPGAISPSGEYFAYSQYIDSSHSSISLVDLASGKVSSLTSGQRQDVEPAWTSDGRRVVFLSCGEKITLGEVFMPEGCGNYAVELSGEGSISPADP